MWIVFFSQGIIKEENVLVLERSNVMFNVICDIMAHWDAMLNSIIFAINFCNAIKMNCALISNINERKCLSIVLHLEPCNVMFKVISDMRYIDMQYVMELFLHSISAMQLKLFVH